MNAGGRAGGAGRRRWPAQGRIGLALLALSWGLDWSLPGLRTHLLFFPLWLGYCLAVDGWVLSRTGTSLLARSRRRFAGLFLASAPAWWLFEAINARTRNWVYLGREAFSDAEYFLLASVAFSTVMPAVFETAELVRSFLPGRAAVPDVARRLAGRVDGAGEGSTGRLDVATRRPPLWLLPAGGLALVAVLARPESFFPLVWVSLWLILEPLNGLLGHRTLWSERPGERRRTLLALMLGALVCGFFWELWNWRSYPKWVYRVPYLDRWHLFEMPLAGYGGYLPFSLELFALYQLMAGLSERLRRRAVAGEKASLARYVLPAA